MSEPRQNHLVIDGGQVKEDEHPASYKPIPDSDSEFRKTKSKSKEKLSSDGAEEKLLSKEDEAKIVTRVDMADAKYVVGENRNGAAKIELDANRREYSFLTKEDLIKYAEDPFWVRLRWALFILFWAMWLCMLAAAIAIIVGTPKCAQPEPKKWYEVGPLVEYPEASADFTELEEDLPLLKEFKVNGVFVPQPTYEVLDEPDIIQRFSEFVKKAAEYGVKIIVELTPGYVSSDHIWFQKSENGSEEYKDYFIWANSTGFDTNENRLPPNNWVSYQDTPAWNYSETRRMMYLQQHGEMQPDLNFNNTRVVSHFSDVITKYMTAGAGGIRLRHARTLLVAASLADEPEAAHARAAHSQRAYYRQRHSADRAELRPLLARWAALADQLAEQPGQGETVFTMKEDGDRAELFLSLELALRPPSAAATSVAGNLTTVAAVLNKILPYAPAIQLMSEGEPAELAAFAMLLPATPVFTVDALRGDNGTSPSESLSGLVSLRGDASVQHGQFAVAAVPAHNSTDTLLACARWKAGHTGYVSLYNAAGGARRANLTELPALPPRLALHRASRAVKQDTGYAVNQQEDAESVLVPAHSSVVLSYVPVAAVKN